MPYGDDWLLLMDDSCVKVIKDEVALLEERVHAFKVHMEKILSKQAELQKRLSDAEERAHETADLRQKYEQVLSENELLKKKIEQCKN